MNLLAELIKHGLVSLFEGAEVEEIYEDVWMLKLDLGEIPAGTYKGGYWGDAQIDDTDAVLRVTVGDIYGEGEFDLGEGVVNLNYIGDTGLAYTGELETLVTDRIADLYGLQSSGSEQGMQGDNYLSLDVWAPEKQLSMYSEGATEGLLEAELS